MVVLCYRRHSGEYSIAAMVIAAAHAISACWGVRVVKVNSCRLTRENVVFDESGLSPRVEVRCGAIDGHAAGLYSTYRHTTAASEQALYR